ncbi:MAG: hypothetical protein QM790_05925 [Nibricoccus sp.]
MRQILECFDAELLDRSKNALTKAGVQFSSTAVERDALSGWIIEVDTEKAGQGAAIVEKIAQQLESERSSMRCSQCGCGMVLVNDDSSESEESVVLEYRCPKCGAPGLGVHTVINF